MKDMIGQEINLNDLVVYPGGRWFVDGKPLKIKLVRLGNESEECVKY